MSNELYKKHRPKTFKGVLGQDAAVKKLAGYVEKGRVPHSLLFTGPSGTGKTTLARILATKLKCAPVDFNEMNSADFRGIESIREIRRHLYLAPVGGESRIHLIDEAHKLSSDAQNAFLKMLEDTPKRVYFMLCTTDPQKLIHAVRTRCDEIQMKLLGNADMGKLVSSVCEKEDIELTKRVFNKLVEVACGSARKALVLLHGIVGLDEEEQINAIEDADTEVQAIQLVRKLLSKGANWKEVAPLIKGIKEEPESLRRMMLGYAASILLNSGSPHASRFINIFQYNWFDSGKAGLANCCYEFLKGGK